MRSVRERRKSDNSKNSKLLLLHRLHKKRKRKDRPSNYRLKERWLREHRLRQKQRLLNLKLL